MAANFAKLPNCQDVRSTTTTLSGYRSPVGGKFKIKPGGHAESEQKVGHSLCDHRNVASNLGLHIWGVTVEACSHAGDVIGCVSHSKLHQDGIKDLCLSSFY
jgi:hypothetical protein